MKPDFTCDHIHLRSTDPDSAARFYTDMLGFAEISRAKGPSGLRVDVALGALRLFIEETPADTPAPPAPPFQGIEHFALATKNLDDAAADLLKRGVEFTLMPMSPRPGVKISFIQAPDGVIIELLQRG